ncbi:PREDICTED: FAD-dependent oxidoreductase domain-containing protein 1-like [Nicrophorus vespilloides]|uniref:FAD-dependent oxidoreductase domain-containing protein 1-like n=1 Tax=Nicrophorus vespilloides TaxID=110193 RepID=A0ABM1MC45_NICVS|nr:PREDICTED: FAD-dependent oxidoreductase domain-containing protein 1-like [Nicrophorus vespilloides]
MLFQKISSVCNQGGLLRRFLHTNKVQFRKHEHPFSRTWRILGDDMKKIVNPLKREEERGPYMPLKTLPPHADIVIIGGGAVGSSIAYWIKEKTGLKGLNLVVIEKDLSYSKCSTVLSMGGLRQQFSLPENIHMSLFGAEFMRTLKKRFGEDADVYFTPNGYLMMASEQGAGQLMDNYKLQKELGAVNTLLGKEALKKRFPFLNVDDVELGCLGLEKEGWFDPWSFLCLMRRGAMDLGANYISGEVVDFTFENRDDIYVEGIDMGEYEGLDEIVVKTADGELNHIKFAYAIIAGGGDSGEIARKARIGTGPGMLSIPLPVEKRKRYVYHFECQSNEMPGINTPLTIDYTGTYFRRDGLGGTFLCGLSPEAHEEPSIENLDVDHQFFDERVWPILAHRVPAFNSLKVKNAWGGYYDYNCYDENGIIGPHPYYHNLYMATGFSGHGIQQAPAVGRAVSELILDGGFQTIDLTRLGFDRLIVDKPMFESNIV